ncbi:Homeobox-like_domain superfamily [Hexamita inflata]|uniref:Homeobox-like_domain superfamily n=1 Tax=Hexamita inflata TaxID=28002 RepID=A0ABP1HHT3_9EUKA
MIITRWSEDEKKLFFQCLQLYSNDFYSYTLHLNRTHSQIKSYYHNWLNKHNYRHRNARGGHNIPFRNQTQIQQIESISNNGSKNINSLLITNYKSYD